ncbi:UNVERIFIED_CONTAM: hypothetical protein FKN15_054057, partial [Acipenser sinensis]
RKNPMHFQEFSHPGDSDYQEDKASDEDESDNRPECPYGTDCYRTESRDSIEAVSAWPEHVKKPAGTVPDYHLPGNLLELKQHDRHSVRTESRDSIETVSAWHVKGDHHVPEASGPDGSSIPDPSIESSLHVPSPSMVQSQGKSVLADDSDEDGQSNEYDLEDSFINDEEDFDHTDEDSDYEPESDDSAKEDIAELKKEAKQFVNRRK